MLLVIHYLSSERYYLSTIIYYLVRVKTHFQNADFLSPTYLYNETTALCIKLLPNVAFLFHIYMSM